MTADTTRRRDFLALLGGAAALPFIQPLTVRAQQQSKPVIGLLGGATAAGWAPYLAAFREGLSEVGYAEGRNVAIEYRWAEGQYDRLPALAADLIQHQVTMITAFTTPAGLAAKAATTTIPVVFTTISDPVKVGLVSSLSRPGGNVTGVTHLSVEVGPKLVELLHELVPSATSFGLLVNPANPSADAQVRDMQAAAGGLGLQLQVVKANAERDIDAAFQTLIQASAGGVVIAGDSLFGERLSYLADVALRNRIPSIFSSRAFAAAGGLMSYGGSQTDQYRQAGVYTGRVLKGEKPADLPVMQSAKVELIVNLKTAKALGVEIPMTLLARADEVIE